MERKSAKNLKKSILLTPEDIKTIYTNGEILKAYIWYDGHILWCFEYSEEIYLAYNNAHERDKEYFEYMFTLFDSNLEKKAEAGEIGIKELFKNSEKVYVVREYFYGKKPAEYWVVENIADDMFSSNIDKSDINYFGQVDMDKSDFQ